MPITKLTMTQPREFIDEAFILGGSKTVNKGAVQAALDSLLGLDGPNTTKGLQDVVFVAIDFENHTNIRNAFSKTNQDFRARDCQFGISVLDTRDFFHTNAQHMLSTQNFSTGALPYRTRALKTFRFGVSETISIYDITSKVEKALSRKDKRDVILVCHGHEPGGDTRTINSLFISADAKPLRAVLSTTALAQDLLGHGPDGKGSWRLDQLFTEFRMDHLLPDFEHRPAENEILYSMFHNAGNDANFTLRVLLMLAVRGYENRNITSSPEPPLVQLLREISHAPFPAPRSITEVEILLTLQPQEPLDNPAIPVDTSRFRGKKPKLRKWQEMTEETRRYRAAARLNKVPKKAYIPKKEHQQPEPLQAQDLNLSRCSQDDNAETKE